MRSSKLKKLRNILVKNFEIFYITNKILIYFVLLDEIQFSLAKRKLQQLHETPRLLSHLKDF